MKLAIPFRFRHGSALLIILACVTLVTVLVVSLLLLSRFERAASSLALSRAQTESLADYAADVAIGRLREAIDSGRKFNVTGYSMWASEPGQIHVVNVDTNGIMIPSARAMYSALPGADDPQFPERRNVDLNKAALSGNHPVTGSQPGTMKIGWINLLADPGKPASKENPIVSRVAYWVDDESCRVNVNTADGSQKYSTNSFGFGTPSEINLQALPSGDGSTFLSKSQAEAIAQYAWDYGFNAVAEVKRVVGIPKLFYETNKFDLTAFSKTPELTFFGEPRIYLFPTVDLTSPYVDYTRSANSGAYGVFDTTVTAYAFSGDNNKRKSSDYLDFVYPTPLQLPKMKVVGTTSEPLIQFTPKFVGGPITKSHLNYHFAARIAKAIKGITSQGDSFAWPAFAHATPGGFGAKYNDRQIDSIALNLIDAATIVPSVNQNRFGFNTPTLIGKGMLSGELVTGIGRSPKLTEIKFSIDAFNTDLAYKKPDGTTDDSKPTPTAQIDMELEFYLPANFAGDPVYCWDFRVGNEGSISQNAINQNDHCGQYWDTVEDKNTISWAAPMGGYWDDQLLTFMDGASPTKLAGIDLRAHTNKRADPETAKSALYHPYAYGKGGSNYGSSSPYFKSTLQVMTLEGTPIGAPSTDSLWRPGRYHGIQAINKGGTDLYASRDVTSFMLQGGATVWGRDASGTCGWETVPLDSYRTVAMTGEDPKTIVSKLQEAVIPVPPNFRVELDTYDNIWHARVADPLVNKFPGDWMVTANPPDSEMTLTAQTIPAKRTWGSASNNPEFLPTKGGDPLSVWLPRQDITYPKQSRFPSIGALNYLRTGIIPDDLSAPLPQQKGTPWRTINLSASSSLSQTTTAGSTSVSYPDWAMLDLFTVPFTPQKPFLIGETATPRRVLTYGGATEGKLNINNPRKPHPFDQFIAGVAQTPPERTAPLDALFLGIQTSTTYSEGGSHGYIANYVTIDQSQAANLRDAVQRYLANNGPFLLAGQLAEVPEINAYTYAGVVEKSRSRNDLMREVVGATTTQSNVFSIWVVTQTIKKKSGNPNPGLFEPGDVVTGETRRRYLVERFIETGLDGVPGNTTALTPSTIAPFNDGVPGTADDPVSPQYHPAFASYPLPYRWRILSVSNPAG